MKRTVFALLATLAAIPIAGAAPSRGADGTIKLRATLTAAPPVIANSKGAVGRGTFTATVSIPKQTITWKLAYKGLTGPVVAAHIHVGQPEGTEQGVLIELCKPCKAGAQRTQPLGFGPAAVIAMLRGNKTYVNVHTTRWLYGEVRGQLKVVR
jgi:CHRD domain-containing protein